MEIAVTNPQQKVKAILWYGYKSKLYALDTANNGCTRVIMGCSKIRLRQLPSTMLEKIKFFFEKHITLVNFEGDIEEKLKVASAALFMEMMHMEKTCENQKQHLILLLLEQRFGLTDEQAADLMEIAEHKREHATDYFEFTHLICSEFTKGQKIQLIESLWKIAFLDNRLDVEEEYLIDKVSRLLFIPHMEVLQARNRTKEP